MFYKKCDVVELVVHSSVRNAHIKELYATPTYPVVDDVSGASFCAAFGRGKCGKWL